MTSYLTSIDIFSISYHIWNIQLQTLQVLNSTFDPKRSSGQILSHHSSTIPPPKPKMDNKILVHTPSSHRAQTLIVGNLRITDIDITRH